MKFKITNHVLLELSIILTVAIAKVSSTCPSKCTCQDTTVSCIQKDLEDVPLFETINIDPVVIDLSGNKLISIDIFDFSFERNTELKELYLNNSEITDIEDKCFDELVSLQELYLNNNNLRSIPPNVVKKNQNMVLIDLSNNIFEELPVINSTTVEVLAMANSGISSVSPKSLSDLPNLRLLLLQENKLKELNPTVFGGLKNFFFVKLTYNLWNCNCNTIKLFEFLTKEGYTEVTDQEPIQCLTSGKDYLDIYYSNGTSPYFQQTCHEDERVAKENKEIYIEYKRTKQLLGESGFSGKHSRDSSSEIPPNHKPNDRGGNIKGHDLIKPELNPLKEDAVNKTVQNKTSLKNTEKIDLKINQTSRGEINITERSFTQNETVYGNDVCNSDDFYEFMKIVLLVTVPLTFLIGMLFGCYLMFVYGSSYMKINMTESSKRLLSPSIEQVKEEIA